MHMTVCNIDKNPDSNQGHAAGHYHSYDEYLVTPTSESSSQANK